MENNNGINNIINGENWKDLMEIFGFTPPVHKQLTKEEFERQKYEKYMDEKVEVTVEISRRDLELFKALKDYEDYEQGIEIPTKYYIKDLINKLVNEKMDYFNLIQKIHDINASLNKTKEHFKQKSELERKLREQYGNRVLALIPNEETFYNKILEIRGY